MRTSIPAVIFAIMFAIVFSPLAAQSQTNPMPFVNDPLVPAATPPNGPGFTLTVNGAGFVSGAVVKWNGSPRVTTFVSGTQVTAAILASDLTAPASVFVSVTNPAPGGGLSNVVIFEVTTPTTTLAFNQTNTNFPVDGDSSLDEPASIVAGNFENNATPFMAVANETCIFGDTCLIDKASIAVVNQTQEGNGFILAEVPGVLAAGDFNGDGILDLITPVQFISTETAGFSVSLGNGDGTFQDPIDDSLPSAPAAFQSFMALGDFNRDGHLDVVFAGYSTIYFLPGNGDGTFGTPALLNTGTISSNSNVAAGDFNRDGILDLAISDQSANAISVLLGNGDGTFQAPVNYPADSSPTTIVVADFNGDGKPDLAVLNYLGNSISVFLGNGDGTFQPKVDYPGGPLTDSMVSLTLGDYNGDGVLDLAVGDGGQCGDGCPATGSINILLGNGDGSFRSPLNFATLGSPDYVVTGEFGDPLFQVGHSGFVVSNYAADTVSIFAPVQPTTGGTNPPTITSFSPTSAFQATAAFTLTVNGTNFVSGSTIYFGGIAQTTTFVSATQLTASISANALVTEGPVPIVVTTPGPDGGSSTASEFQVLLPPPTISSLSVQSVVAGSPAFTLTINGTNFVFNTLVEFNGAGRATTYVSPTQVTAAVLTSDLATPGSISITVTTIDITSDSGGGTSSPVIFTVLPTSTQPTVGGLSPASATAGGASFTLLITGTGFGNSSSVTFGGTTVTAAFMSPTVLQATIPASLIAVAGTPLVTVTNPPSSASVATSFTVNNPIPAVGSVLPATVPEGNAALNISVSGTNFVSTSKVLVNGTSRVTTYVSSTSLTAALLASDFAQNGMLSLTVTNPTPGGGTTGGVALVVSDYNVTAQSTMMSVTAGAPANYNLMLAPENGKTANAVTFAVTSGLPAGTMATFAPSATFPAGTSQMTVMLSITTTAHLTASAPYFPLGRWPRGASPNWLVVCIAFLAMGILAMGFRTRRLAPQLLIVLLLLCAAGLAACGGSISGTPSPQLNPATGTPAGTYTIVVTATSGSASVNTNLIMIVN